MYTLSLPQSKRHLAQTVSNAKVEKPDLGVLTLFQRTLSGCVLGARVDVSYRLQHFPWVAASLPSEGIMGVDP